MPAIKRISPSESAEQKLVIEWRNYMCRQTPALKWLHSIPNGGARDAATGALMKAEGVTKGIPDLFLPVARGKYHGLYIELKRRSGGKITVEQKEFAEYAKSAGFAHKVCFGAVVAVQTIEIYLQNGEV